MYELLYVLALVGPMALSAIGFVILLRLSGLVGAFLFLATTGSLLAVNLWLSVLAADGHGATDGAAPAAEPIVHWSMTNPLVLASLGLWLLVAGVGRPRRRRAPN
ncbi:hypothetical protein [Methylobacterium sp. J-070]|uniref:hypothetical protein n=1 Tax=Methylobacterium sp. J-070 TaxID=2836650 RepID=UPI001FBB9603|nr:hypothetical protein [Methylobacterium sp. J-070]MCJ2053853.1 hypothetical protein [Methylobacterium sp. J-070]